MPTNTKRRITFTVDIEADDHDSPPLSDVLGFVREGILGNFGQAVGDKMWESVTKRMQGALLTYLGHRNFADMVEQAIIDNISSEGWSILAIEHKITDADSTEADR